MMKYKSCTDYWLNKDDLSLRGDFESMYQDIDDPWGCGEFSDSINNKLFCEMIFHKRDFSTILDIGSGLGNLTEKLFAYSRGSKVTGWDISETATSKAAKKYPKIIFENKNIMLDTIDNPFDLITIAEVMWYFLDNIDDVFMKTYNGLNKDGVLAIHQYFPKDQNFGKDVIEGLEGFEGFIENKTGFKFVNKIVSHVDDGQVLLALLKKES